MSEPHDPARPPEHTASLGHTERPVGSESLEQPGDDIGPYKLLSLLGEGGFGSVWLAERRQPFRQQVALKLVKPGMDSKAVLGRFQQERQALALMDHPHVARVLDGGVTPRGRPYFAMEYVRGEPINAFCDRHRLDLRARLELFVQVCEGVQHAHMKGIIHRDLKPGNVIVTMVEGDRAEAKVIDFGVAKALTQTLSVETIFTESGQMIGTPEYMSPEQAEPGAIDIDTRTDVYGLGVILYELLSGALPFDSRDLRSKDRREVQRIIREQEPPTPSARLSTIVRRDDARASQIAQSRREGVPRLTRTLRRELEWIPLKAMRKERGDRYASPADLARDIRNYLVGQPLVAAPLSKAYRARKFLMRHRVAVGALVALITVVVLAIVLAGWQWRMGVRFLDRTLVQPAVTAVDREFADHPAVGAHLRQVLADRYAQLGLLETALPLQQAALTTRRDELGDTHPDTLQSAIGLAALYRDSDRPADAVALLRAIEPTARGTLTDDHAPRLAAMLIVLGESRAQLPFNPSRYATAESNLHEAYDILSRGGDASDPQVQRCIRSLAALQGDWESKEPERGHRVKASEWKAKLRATPTP
jgi:eukaryotic-like serine/threonine-protein kinase